MAERVNFTLQQSANPHQEDGDSETLLSLDLTGGSVLDEELYATTAAEIAVAHGFYYKLEHRRIHSELGASAEWHEIQLALMAGAAGGVSTALVQEVATALRRLASVLRRRGDNLSEAEIIQNAVAYASALDDPPRVVALETRESGERVVKLTTATDYIRVELNESGRPLRITRRKKRAPRKRTDNTS